MENIWKNLWKSLEYNDVHMPEQHNNIH
jgi:hypothetical protein